MSAFTTVIAHEHAIDVVKSALVSGELKLLGPTFDKETSAARAAADIIYLTTVITGVAKGISRPG